MSLLLFLDADSLPIKYREIIIKRCIKENIESYFVADRQLKDVLDSIKEHTLILRKPYRAVLSNKNKCFLHELTPLEQAKIYIKAYFPLIDRLYQTIKGRKR